MNKSLPSFRKIWSIVWPLMVGLLAENLVGAIDTAFLGRVGEVELGASALAGTFYIILFTIGMGFGTGTQILIGRRNGEGRFRRIGPIMENSLYFVWALSAVIVCFTLWLAPSILSGIVQNAQIYDATVRFLNIRVFTLFFSLGCVIMRSFFIGITLTRYIGMGALIIAGTNFVLDYVLIFGKFGFPQMGLEGAALASVLAEVAGMLFFLIIILRKVDLKKYHLFHWARPNMQLTHQTFKLSGYTMLMNVLSLSGWFFFFVIVEKTGTLNLAVANIIRSFYILSITPLWAYGAAVSTLVSNAIGRGQGRYVLKIMTRVTLLSSLTSGTIMVLSMCFPHEIIRMYTNDPVLIEMAYKGILVVGIANFINAFCCIAFASVSATGNTQKALLFEIITLVFYFIAIWKFALGYPHQAFMVWFSEVIYYVVLGTISWIYMRWGKWANRSF